MGVMRVMGRKGDEETRWDPKDMRSVTYARLVFEQQRKDNMVAWLIDDHGEGSEELKTFKPEAKEIIFTKQLIGG